jgi:hypothetical protein
MAFSFRGFQAADNKGESCLPMFCLVIIMGGRKEEHGAFMISRMI